jgi:NADH:ubiquinone oxidoreductase subunit 6 (subunit J)
LGFEFFGFLFLLIYIGAISIFFLLVIMLINVESIVIQLTSKRFVVVQIIFVSSLLGVFMLFYLFFNDILIVLFNNDQDFFLRNVFFTLYTDHIDLLGQLLFTKYGLWTFFFGILLLIILIISLILLNNNWYTSMRLEK